MTRKRTNIDNFEAKEFHQFYVCTRLGAQHKYLSILNIVTCQIILNIVFDKPKAMSNVDTYILVI